MYVSIYFNASHLVTQQFESTILQARLVIAVVMCENISVKILVIKVQMQVIKIVLYPVSVDEKGIGCELRVEFNII